MRAARVQAAARCGGASAAAARAIQAARGAPKRSTSARHASSVAGAVAAAGALAFEVAAPPGELVRGQLRLVRVDVEAVGIDPHEQVARVEARLEPHRQQGERELRGDQGGEVVRVLAGDQLRAQALEVRRRGRGGDRRMGGGQQRVPRLPRRRDPRALGGDVGAELAGQRLDRGLAVARVRELGVRGGELCCRCGELRLRGLELARWPRPADASRALAALRVACACWFAVIAARSASNSRRCAAASTPGGGCPPSSCIRSRRSWRASSRPCAAAVGGGFGVVGGRVRGARLGGHAVARLRRRRNARLRLGDRLLQDGDAPGELREVGPYAGAVGLRGDEPVGEHERVGLGRLPARARRGDRREVGHQLLLAISRDACSATRNGCWNVSEAVAAAFLPQRALHVSGGVAAAWTRRRGRRP